MTLLGQRFWRRCLIVLLGFQSVLAAEPASPFTLPDRLNDAEAGQDLASSLRNACPTQDAEFRGRFKIRPRGGTTTHVPVISRVLAGGTSWQTVYQAWPESQAETLIVLHAVGRPNEYRFTTNLASCGSSPPPVVPHERIWQAFAGSDFDLGDLGLEFFHWPSQVLVRNEMRKGRACHVLESRPAVTNAYSRVVSWIDVETEGLLMAEAYDRDNRRAKEFEVKSFKKVEGQWQLREMEIRNLAERSRTILELDVAE